MRARELLGWRAAVVEKGTGGIGNVYIETALNSDRR